MNKDSILTDAEIRQKLKELGFNPGPITNTTRKVYLTKLSRLEKSRNETIEASNLENDDEEPEPPSYQPAVNHWSWWNMTPKPKKPSNHVFDNPKFQEAYESSSPEIMVHQENHNVNINPPSINRLVGVRYSPIHSPTRNQTPFRANRDIVTKNTSTNYPETSPMTIKYTETHTPCSKYFQSTTSSSRNVQPSALSSKFVEDSALTNRSEAKTPFRSVINSPTVKSPEIKKAPTKKASTLFSSLANLKSPDAKRTRMYWDRIKRYLASPVVIYIAYMTLLPICIAIFYPIIFQMVKFTRSHGALIATAAWVVPLIIILFYIFRFLYRKRQSRISLQLREKYEYIDRVLDILKQQVIDFNHKKVSSPYIPILHKGVYLVIRKSKASLWNSVTEFVTKNESRVRTELQNVQGKDCQVWRWIAREFESESSGIISKDSDIYASLSPCLKVYVGEGVQCTFDDFCDHFLRTLNTFGFKVVDSDKVPARQTLYIKMTDKQTAIDVFNRFNKSTCLGRPVKIKFIKESRAKF
ncbi:LEM domain-containing protein 2 [Thelohanellus kitauei]|uniref:LEM domain-containing protein 2 n=1 Tax=Thelohanellus kitauei TaxID=669202 RepID=A0A0C2MG98_THEKT|nr:LEM domain-containing protein 2 [Thelohanellus kitauei]